MKIEPPSGAAPGPGAALTDWLAYIERQHPQAIAMGLDRVAEVRDRLGLSLTCPVITVGGTNGKGSTCAMLESIAAAAGYRVGLYMSPHLTRYNERVRIDRRMASDAALCEAFRAVEQARGTVPLTYFEFGTLGAAWLFARAGLDLAILEVGLGGRLDAVNVFDADCAVVTSIGLDHMDLLGPTRESIGFEKAGIFRAGRPAVIAEPDPPASMRDAGRTVGVQWLQGGVDFRAESDGLQWRYVGPGGTRSGLPHPALRGSYQLGNAAGAITALDTLRERLPVSANAIREGLVTVELAGRFQVLPGRPVAILDVAHNPHAAERFAGALGAMTDVGATHAVFAMLRDKDIEGVARTVKTHVDRWYVAPLPGPRGAAVPALLQALDAAQVFDPVQSFDSVAAALAAARAAARPDDRIVVFGSFLTVAQALETLGG
ncbi:MAG: bifunctional tetrahydrofolate synthase/dihydrofolate synthase [Burkholderiales bacterium]|nr:bifunctional tetrahydrofolate synthase/dihydrofolate synthase [Burkholderiales bacterium]